MRTSAQDTYAFVQLDNGRAREVIDTLKTLPMVESVEALKGPYQLVVRLDANDAAELRGVDGVTRVVTLAPATPMAGAGPGRASEKRRRSLRISQPCGAPA